MPRTIATSTATCATRSARSCALFVDSVFREDRSVLELLTADYTFLNERLALHYGITRRAGRPLPPRAADDTVRSACSARARVLMVTSYPNRTSPVLRGAWILENIMGTPPRRRRRTSRR